MKQQTETSIMDMSSKGPTPEQKAEIDRVVALFDLDWMIDVKTMEIRRKPRNFFQKIKDFFWPRRHSVFALYWWLKHQYHKNHRTELMAFTFPINHDNMPIPGYPMKYEIVGEWSIPKKDLKYLIKGPLARISPSVVLVPHQIGFERIKSFAKAWGPVITAIAMVLTIILRALQIYDIL